MKVYLNGKKLGDLQSIEVNYFYGKTCVGSNLIKTKETTIYLTAYDTYVLFEILEGLYSGDIIVTINKRNYYVGKIQYCESGVPLIIKFITKIKLKDIR